MILGAGGKVPAPRRSGSVFDLHGTGHPYLGVAAVCTGAAFVGRPPSRDTPYIALHARATGQAEFTSAAALHEGAPAAATDAGWKVSTSVFCSMVTAYQ
jgi:hypothetical protein